MSLSLERTAYASDIAELVYIGNGGNTHYRADGTGPVPAGRARCELDQAGDYEPYYKPSSRDESPARPAPPGEPTCHWCRTRDLPA